MLHPEGNVAILNEFAWCIWNFTVDQSHRGPLILRRTGPDPSIRMETVTLHAYDANGTEAGLMFEDAPSSGWAGGLLRVSNLTWDSNYSYVMYARCYPEGTVYDPHTWILNTYEQSDNQMKNTNDGDIPGLPRLFQDPCS